MSLQHEDPLLCPTFSSYTCDRLVEIATKVSDDYKNIVGEENDDDLFEFALSMKEFDSSFVNKSVIFPVFNCENLHNRNEIDTKIENLNGIDLVPLKNLFIEERKNRISTSSSDLGSDSDSDSEPAYCVWRRKSIGSSPSRCKKSKSTGSVLVKQFKIRDLLLRRSNSDGKDSILNKSTNKIINYRKSPRHSIDVTGKSKTSPASSAHELFYIQNRSMREGNKRKSYLPYRKDLIGFFSVLGRASRT